MAQQTLAIQLLVSAPGDVPSSDLAVIRKTISQWNVNFGRTVGLTVLPVSWTEHAVAEFGERPQAIINDQPVGESDMAIALFHDRLGTPTGQAESGTAEEIRELVEAGKPVAVLLNNSSRPPLSGDNLGERQRLDEYLDEIRKSSLVLAYTGDAELVGHINNFLSRSTGQFQQGADESKRSDGPDDDDAVGVWPRVEVRETVETDSKGRAKTKKRWSLVLHNTSKGPASDVDFEFEDLPEGALFRVHRDPGPIGTSPPGREARFPLLLAWGSPSAVDCVVTWKDTNGGERETRATVRT